MAPADNVDRLNTLFKNRVTCMLHNCLWQILINGAIPNAAFTLLGPENNIVLALQEGGYVNT